MFGVRLPAVKWPGSRNLSIRGEAKAFPPDTISIEGSGPVQLVGLPSQSHQFISLLRCLLLQNSENSLAVIWKKECRETTVRSFAWNDGKAPTNKTGPGTRPKASYRVEVEFTLLVTILAVKGRIT